MDYLNMVMQQLATILYNTSQSNSESYSKDRILNAIKNIVQDYNDVVPESSKVKIKDFRNK